MSYISWLSRSAQAGYFTLACTALALGLTGVVTPLLPATPFVLVSAWAAAKSSQRLHGWLHSNAIVGPLLVNWQRDGAISESAKRLAIFMLALSALILLLLELPLGVLVACVGLFFIVGAYIYSRPLPAARVAQSPTGNKMSPHAPKKCETIALYAGSKVYADSRAYRDPEAYYE